MSENKLAKIYIKNLNLACYIGITESERSEKQPVLVHVIMHAEVEHSFTSDNIADTVDYKKIYLEIIKLTDKKKFNLLEKLADEIAAIVLTERYVRKVDVRVEKPNALNLAECAGVEINKVRGER